MDGGQFTKFFGGVNYSQQGTYSAHTPSQPNGLVSYSGNYVGLINWTVPRPNTALPLPAGTNDDFAPHQASRVIGDVLINADFTDMRVNGAISNRLVLDQVAGIGLTVPTVYLIPTDIAVTDAANGVAGGTFTGDIQIGSLQSVGTYAGTFGGIQASGLAAGIHLDGDFIVTRDGEEEYGLVVLNKCGTPGEGAFC
jgi:hypothetical protein